jgi:hypothetical protein
MRSRRIAVILCGSAQERSRSDSRSLRMISRIRMTPGSGGLVVSGQITIQSREANASAVTMMAGRGLLVA